MVIEKRGLQVKKELYEKEYVKHEDPNVDIALPQHGKLGGPRGMASRLQSQGTAEKRKKTEPRPLSTGLFRGGGGKVGTKHVKAS